ncbi:hypothetical protein DPQ33_13265 [Oceanidesulfovibrio indonesiensis]|uniref:Transposase n=1 Tax=Oceanidesulfovibrio indonesiensis TaxID=54767 RepID=A0A7M3MCV9_9BACT|nr:hypothetical protein DPQ33_13265 [Oceanidesulfovibrio indonesiensis]
MSRHEISDDLWHRLEPHVRPTRTPPRTAQRGHPPYSQCGHLGFAPGAPWRDLPEEFGPWQKV